MEEIKVEAPKGDKKFLGNDVSDEFVQKIELDAVLAYKNLLALEDHLMEFHGTAEEEADVAEILMFVRDLRDRVMPEESDKRFHCATKHALAALVALEEIEKAIDVIEGDRTIAHDNLRAMREIASWSLEKLWGHELENCKRCK